MAQNNKFRTWRRRWNVKRSTALATARMLNADGGVKRAAHETLKSAIKRDNDKA